MFAYCLFCNALKREQLSLVIRQLLDVEVIVPKIIQRKWVKGKAYEDIHDYLPSYLFLYADAPVSGITKLLNLENIYRVLGNKENGYCLSDSDLAFAMLLRSCGGIIGVLKTYREGDQVRLVDGAMKGVDGIILKLDRRGRALVRFAFDGLTIQSWIAIDIIDNQQK